jgi:hypothetical protein
MMGGEMEASELARLLAARRKRHPRVCPECGRAFEGLAVQRFCSGVCRHRASSKAYYRRHREAVLARQAAWRRRRKAQREASRSGDITY